MSAIHGFLQQKNEFLHRMQNKIPSSHRSRKDSSHYIPSFTWYEYRTYMTYIIKLLYIHWIQPLCSHGLVLVVCNPFVISSSFLPSFLPSFKIVQTSVSILNKQKPLALPNCKVSSFHGTSKDHPTHTHTHTFLSSLAPW